MLRSKAGYWIRRKGEGVEGKEITVNGGITLDPALEPRIHFERKGKFHLKCVVQGLYFHFGKGVRFQVA